MHKVIARALGLALCLGLLPTLVRADAPADQYKAFLPSDAQLEDRFTGLIWDRLKYTPKIPIGALKCPTPGFRVPTVSELVTLLDNEPTRVFDIPSGNMVDVYIDTTALPDTPPEEFWTSSVRPDGGVFVVHFGTGVVRVVPPSELTTTARARLRCVK